MTVSRTSAENLGSGWEVYVDVAASTCKLDPYVGWHRLGGLCTRNSGARPEDARGVLDNPNTNQACADMQS